MTPTLHSYAVVVPALNRASELRATLDSISESMAFFAQHHPRGHEIAGEVIVVDDGSTDGTPDVVRRISDRDPRVRLVTHGRNYGTGAARNTGVRLSSGDVLFFCDADDLFLPEHVFVGFSILECSAGATPTSADPIRLRVGTRGHLALSPASSYAAVRTGVRLADPILPEWHMVVQQTVAQCLCVRRECHDWIEGFPEALVYKVIGGCEDGAYALALNAFFRVGVLDLDTVEYVRRPGNSLDRQMRRFTHPAGSVFDTPTADQLVIHGIRRQLEDDRLVYLLDKWCLLGRPSLSPRLLNWRSVVAELMRRDRRAAAQEVADHAFEMGQPIPRTELDALNRERRPDQPTPGLDRGR